MTHVFWGVKLSAFAIKNSYAINVSYVSILLPKFLINSYGGFKYFLYNVFEVPLHAFGVSTFGPVLYLRIKLEISIYFLVHLLSIPPLESNLFMLPPTLFTPHQLFTPTLLLWKSFHCQQRQIASVVLPKLPYSRRRTFDVSLHCLSSESLLPNDCDERRRR